MIIIAFCAISIYAQDVIFKTSGDSLIVNVQNVDENSVSFSYPNETLQNKIGVENVRKIRFASGREQVFPQVLRILNNNLEIEKHIEVSNSTSRSIKLKISGINKNSGGSIVLFDGEIPSSTQSIQLETAVYKARLDHYTTFVVHCDDPDVIIGYGSDKDLRIYIDNQEKSKVITFDNTIRKPAKDNIKVTNRTKKAQTIKATAIMKDNGSKVEVGQETFKIGADESGMSTKINLKKVAQFFFEIVDGEFNGVKTYVDDDDLYIIID